MVPSAAPHSKRNSVTAAPLQGGAWKTHVRKKSISGQSEKTVLCSEMHGDSHMGLCFNKVCGNEGRAGLTSQDKTTQLGDLHVTEGARHCSGAPGPVVTSQRSDWGPNYPQKQDAKNQKSKIRQLKLHYMFSSLRENNTLDKTPQSNLLNQTHQFWQLFSPQPCLLPWAWSCRFCQAIILPLSSPAQGPGTPLCSPQTVAHSFPHCSRILGCLHQPEENLGNAKKKSLSIRWNGLKNKEIFFELNNLFPNINKLLDMNGLF